MAKPTDIPVWATDPSASVDPGPARKISGFVAGKKLPAKWLNWLLSRQGAWFSYLRDLHTEPEFLNKIYTWTERHAFRGISVGLFGLTVVGGTDNEIVYGDADGTVVPRERTTYIPISGFSQPTPPESEVPSLVSGWILYNGGLAARSPMHDMWMSVSLPTGAVLQNVTARGVDIAMGVQEYAHGPDGNTAGFNQWTDYGNEHSMPMNLSIDNAARTISIRITSNPNGALGSFGFLYWVRLAWLDPGPRNY